MAKKKKVLKLTPSADYLTNCVDRVWDHVFRCAGKINSVFPMLTYMAHGKEYSVPLTRSTFLLLGRDIADNPLAFARMSARMGLEFSLLAMHMAQDAQDAQGAHEEDFIWEIECMIRRIRPQCIVFSAPVLTVEDDKMSKIGGAIEPGIPDGRHPNAVIVTARNPVRTYTMVRQMGNDRSGGIVFGDPQFLDSLRGLPQNRGTFSRVFEPSRN